MSTSWWCNDVLDNLNYPKDQKTKAITSTFYPLILGFAALVSVKNAHLSFFVKSYKRLEVSDFPRNLTKEGLPKCVGFAIIFLFIVTLVRYFPNLTI